MLSKVWLPKFECRSLNAAPLLVCSYFGTSAIAIVSKLQKCLNDAPLPVHSSAHSNFGTMTIGPKFECYFGCCRHCCKSFSGCHRAIKCIQFYPPISFFRKRNWPNKIIDSNELHEESSYQEGLSRTFKIKINLTSCATLKYCYPPASEASRKVANLTEIQNPHTPIDSVKEFVCLSIRLLHEGFFLGTF